MATSATGIDSVTSEARIDLQAEAPDAYRKMVALDGATRLDERLRVLVKLRASLINGCVYCIELHSREGLDAGESQRRLFGLAAWSEAPYFTDRERAALELTDTVTLVSNSRVPDEVWEEAARHFDSAKLADLIWTITVDNAWNRVAISTRMPPPSA